MQKLLD